MGVSTGTGAAIAGATGLALYGAYAVFWWYAIHIGHLLTL